MESIDPSLAAVGTNDDPSMPLTPAHIHIHIPIHTNAPKKRQQPTGRAGDWEGAMGVFEALRGRHEAVRAKEYMKVRACVACVCGVRGF
jgi:hypothetical protein